MRKENFQGFARSFAVRIAFLTLAMLAATAAAELRSEAPPSTQNAPEKDENAGDDLAGDPELIALAWQYGSQANLKRRKQPAWRPDGTRLTDAETIALLDQIESFQTHWHQPGELTPLVMVFQRRGSIKSGLAPAVVLNGRRTQTGATWGPFNAKGFTKSACAPMRRVLAKWPETMVLDVRVPLEDPRVTKTITTIPADAVQVAPGVRWYIDPKLGIEFEDGVQKRVGLKAAVFEIENDEFDNLVDYQSTVAIRGEEQPLREVYATKILSRPNVWATIRVSKPLDEVRTIEKVEFTEQRFKIKRFENIKLRLDLLLPIEDQTEKHKSTATVAPSL